MLSAPFRFHQFLPPANWTLSATALAMLFSFYGFFHWMPFAGVMFGTFLLRPWREWPAWYVLFCFATLIQFVIVGYITYGSLWIMYERHGLALLLIGNAVHPLLAMIAVYCMQKLGFNTQSAVSLHEIIVLHIGATVLALLLTLKDFAYIFTDGMIGDVRRGQIVEMQPIVLPDSLELLIKFGLTHFMGAFVGVMLLVPLALWTLVPANRLGSSFILRSFLIYAPLLPLLVYLANTRIPVYSDDLGGLLSLLMLVLVVVFSFLHGWRGAALSVLVVSSLIAYDDHLHGNTKDILEMQLTVSILGSMALLFGIGMDELRSSRDALMADKIRLRETLSALAESSRRNIGLEETERTRLANELHDDLGQLLTAMQLRLAGSADSPNNAALKRLSENMRESLRSVVNALSPEELNQAGLYQALVSGSPSKLCKFASIDYRVELQGNGLLLDNLLPATALAAYRIVQEAVNNAVKHAHCHRISIRLRIGRFGGARDIVLMIDIRDDGIGLNETAIQAGFHSIRDRALALGGAVRIGGTGGLRVHVLLRQ